MQYCFFHASANCHDFKYFFTKDMKIKIIAKLLFFLLKKVSIPEL